MIRWLTTRWVRLETKSKVPVANSMAGLFVLLCCTSSCHASAQNDSLTQVGPSMQCGSNFQPGYTQCAAKPKPQTAPETNKADVLSPAVPEQKAASTMTPTDKGAGPIKRGVTEEEIDAWLANHGKPSREAARAILDPTDENVAAMARRVRQDAAVAAYVAQRMTTLQEMDPGLVAINPQFNSDDLLYLTGMRVVLHIATGCRSCETAASIMQRLVAESPVLDARIVMHGVVNTNEMMLEMARLGLTLPTTAAGPESKRFAQAVPIAVVADIRQGKEMLIRQFKDTQTTRTAIAVLRKQANAQPISVQSRARQP